MVPVVSMSEGVERGSENHSDGEAPFDEEGGASDDASASEGSTVSLEEDQSDAFTLTTIFERRAHVRVVICAVLSSAFRAVCEEIVNGFSVGERHHSSRVGLEVFFSSSPGCSCADPAEEVLFRGRNWSRGWRFSTKETCSIRMADQSSQRLVRRGRHNSDVEARAVRAVKLVQQGRRRECPLGVAFESTSRPKHFRHIGRVDKPSASATSPT